MKNSLAILAVIAIATSALAVTGCKTPHVEPKRAVACPQCKTVKVLVYVNEDLVSDGARELRTQHECEGCKGALRNWFNNGESEHSCSICSETPFSCGI